MRVQKLEDLGPEIRQYMVPSFLSGEMIHKSVFCNGMLERSVCGAGSMAPWEMMGRCTLL